MSIGIHSSYRGISTSTHFGSAGSSSAQASSAISPSGMVISPVTCRRRRSLDGTSPFPVESPPFEVLPPCALPLPPVESPFEPPFDPLFPQFDLSFLLRSGVGSPFEPLFPVESPPFEVLVPCALPLLSPPVELPFEPPLLPPLLLPLASPGVHLISYSD